MKFSNKYPFLFAELNRLGVGLSPDEKIGSINPDVLKQMEKMRELEPHFIKKYNFLKIGMPLPEAYELINKALEEEASYEN
jgi:hypothetical protein